MQEIETIRNALIEAKIIIGSYSVDAGRSHREQDKAAIKEILNALEALEKLEAKLNKPVDIRKLANISHNTCLQFYTQTGDWTSEDVHTKIAEAIVAELERQRNL